MRALGANATVVLGNHDLHLLALAFGSKRKSKDSDTLDAVLEASDRDQLLEWLLGRPLAVFDEPRGDFLVHAGLVPEWTPRAAAKLAREVEAVLRDDARTLFDAMYGNKPDVERSIARHGPPAIRHQCVHTHALLPAMGSWISR